MTNEPFDPGIGATVRWLQGLGYETTDSGDGVSKPQAWYDSGEAMPVPHVNVRWPCPDTLALAARHLAWLVRRAGVEVRPIGAEGCASIQATYDPADGSASLLVCGVDDAMLRRKGIVA